MRTVDFDLITQAVAEGCIRMNLQLPPDVVAALNRALESEPDPGAKEILEKILENADMACGENLPLCQDTGVVAAFVAQGSEVLVQGGGLGDAINAGVRLGYEKGLMRKSVVAHPLDRKNTEDNTPAVIYFEPGPGDRIVIHLMAKGAGSENMSRVKMFNPTASIREIEDFIVQTVMDAGPNPCPPVIVGIGLGGTFEKAAILSKKALLRPLGERNPDPILAGLEDDILKRVNESGIGPLGFGGLTTALGVGALAYPCHIASLPVAVNLNCHSARHVTIEL